MNSSAIRAARVGDLLDANWVRAERARRIEAAAVVAPGASDLSSYLSELEAARERFGDWDGRIIVVDPDGRDEARVVIVDRYGQVYATTNATEPRELPDADALEEWFRFLATACPECGVPDDPVGRGWTP
jgi:hypothetical protein